MGEQQVDRLGTEARVGRDVAEDTSMTGWGVVGDSSPACSKPLVLFSEEEEK